jgi:outer membrane protein TolC
LIRFVFRLFLIIFIVQSLISFAKEPDVIYLQQTDIKGIPPSQKVSDDGFVKSFYNKPIDVSIEINEYLRPEKLLPVKLEDCICLAMEHNLDIKSSKAREKQFMWDYKNQKTKYYPDASYLFTFSNLNGAFLAGGVIPVLVNETPFQSQFWLDWVIYDGGYRSNKKKAAKNMYTSSQKEVAFTKEEVLRNTAISYYRMLGYKLKIEILTRNIEEIDKQLEINKKLDSTYNVHRSETAQEGAKEKLLVAYRAYRTEQANLANILGIDVDTAIYPTDTGLYKVTLNNSNYTIDDLSSMALISRQDVESIRLKITALKCEQKTLTSEFLPNIAAHGMLGNVGNHRLGIYDSRWVGLTVNYPFGKGFGAGTYTDYQRYNAMLEAARIELENKLRDIRQNIITSYYGIKISQDRINTSIEQIEKANETLYLGLLRLQAGGLYGDVLRSQDDKTNTRLNLVDSVVDYNISQINMLFDTGTMSVYNLLQRKEAVPIDDPIFQDKGCE